MSKSESKNNNGSAVPSTKKYTQQDIERLKQIIEGHQASKKGFKGVVNQGRWWSGVDKFGIPREPIGIGLDGYCNGLSLEYLTQKSKNTESDFFNSIINIANKKNISEKEAEAFYKKIEKMQFPFRFSKKLKQHQLVEAYRLCGKPPVKLVLEDRIPFVFMQKELAVYLKDHIPDKRMISLTNVSHAMAIYKEDSSNYYFYDPSVSFEKINLKHFPESSVPLRDGEIWFESAEELSFWLGFVLQKYQFDADANILMPLTLASLRWEDDQAYKDDRAIKFVKACCDSYAYQHRISKNGYRPLLLASQMPVDKRVVQYYIEQSKEADIDLNEVAIDCAMTPLYLAIQNGNEEAASQLLLAGALLNDCVSHKNKYHIFIIGIRSQDARIIKILIDEKAPKDPDENYLEHAIRAAVDLDIFKQIIAYTGSESHFKEAIVSAIEKKNMPILKYLLAVNRYGLNFTALESSPLISAVYYRNEEAKKLILKDSKCNLNYISHTKRGSRSALGHYVAKRKLDCAKDLMNYGAKVDSIQSHDWLEMIEIKGNALYSTTRSTLYDLEWKMLDQAFDDKMDILSLSDSLNSIATGLYRILRDEKSTCPAQDSVMSKLKQKMTDKRFNFLLQVSLHAKETLLKLREIESKLIAKQASPPSTITSLLCCFCLYKSPIKCLRSVGKDSDKLERMRGRELLSLLNKPVDEIFTNYTHSESKRLFSFIRNLQKEMNIDKPSMLGQSNLKS